MKRHIYLGLLAGLVSFSSCNVDLLDIPQQGVTSEETFYKTDEDCEEAIAAVYSAWRTALRVFFSASPVTCSTFSTSIAPLRAFSISSSSS